MAGGRWPSLIDLEGKKMTDRVTVVITGVAGLLGSRLATWILDNIPNSYVIGVDDFSGGLRENVDPRILAIDATRGEFHRGEIASIGLENLIPENSKVDYVFHFAAYASEGLSPFIRKFNYTNNLVVTADVINWSIKHGVKRLVFTSSMAVYGSAKLPFNENMQPDPIDPYGVAKYAAEMDIKIAGDQHGLDWCIVRPHNVFGIGQNIFDPYRNVLGIWMYRHLHDKSLLIYGDGSQQRAFSYIDDSLFPLWNAADNPSASKQIINLGGIKEVSILEAAHILIGVMGSGDVEFAPPRHEVKEAYSTFEKSQHLLGFEHKTDLEDGLKKMWDWAKRVPMRDRFVWEKYELDKGLYSFWNKEELTWKNAEPIKEK